MQLATWKKNMVINKNLKKLVRGHQPFMVKGHQYNKPTFSSVSATCPITCKAPSFLLGSLCSAGVFRILTQVSITGSRVPFLFPQALARKWMAATVGDTRSSNISVAERNRSSSKRASKSLEGCYREGGRGQRKGDRDGGRKEGRRREGRKEEGGKKEGGREGRRREGRKEGGKEEGGRREEGGGREGRRREGKRREGKEGGREGGGRKEEGWKEEGGISEGGREGGREGRREGRREGGWKEEGGK